MLLFYNALDLCLDSSTNETKSEGHVFISYQWDAQKTVLKIKDRLKQAGFRVWIDVEKICEFTKKKLNWQ